ncbi:MAG: molybdopterin-guanine dinucleotide biosynthesis protein B [Deltaproteobacteria bacterium]|nr:molybdopterin-guanine dinucleotide biosynthesis protein B [Deltaproteobacteria bacterium]
MTRPKSGPAVVSIVGKSNSGKTTLIEKLLPRLAKRGIRVGTVKHDVHGFQMDREGKDSYRHKKAGALITVISSPRQIGMVRDVDHDHRIEELVDRYFPDVDLVLTEGYKREKWPKVEVHRKELRRSLISTADEGLIVVMSDEDLSVEVPCFHLDDVDALAEFLVYTFHLDDAMDDQNG